MRYVEILLACAACDEEKIYVPPPNLRERYEDTHKITIRNVMYETGVKRRLPTGMVEIKSDSMEKEEYEIAFGCPGCYDIFNDLPSLSSHISIIHEFDKVKDRFILAVTLKNPFKEY